MILFATRFENEIIVIKFKKRWSARASGESQREKECLLFSLSSTTAPLSSRNSATRIHSVCCADTVVCKRRSLRCFYWLASEIPQILSHTWRETRFSPPKSSRASDGACVTYHVSLAPSCCTAKCPRASF